MFRKKKFWIILGLVFAGALYLYAFSWIFYNPFLAPRMVKYYSNDYVFCHYSAVISELSEYVGFLYIDSIELKEEDENRISNNCCNVKDAYVQIHSPSIDETWNVLSNMLGQEINFIGSFMIFFDGCEPAIIQLITGEREILKYEDGKAALIEWAKTVY